MGALRLLLGLLVAMAIVSFGVMNMEPVSVTYHRIGTQRIPLFYILLAFFAAGFIVAWLGGLFDRLRFYARFRGYRKEVRSLRRELEEVQEKSGRLLPPSAGPNGEGAGRLQEPAAHPAPGGAAPDHPGKEGRNVSVD